MFQGGDNFGGLTFKISDKFSFHSDTKVSLLISARQCGLLQLHTDHLTHPRLFHGDAVERVGHFHGALVVEYRLCTKIGRPLSFFVIFDPGATKPCPYR